MTNLLKISKRKCTVLYNFYSMGTSTEKKVGWQTFLGLHHSVMPLPLGTVFFLRIMTEATKCIHRKKWYSQQGKTVP